MILHMVAFLPSNGQKTDPRPQVVQKNYRSRPERRITHPTRSDTSMQPYTTPLHARNLARADCTCKSRNEICHFVTILIGERLAVLSVRGSTFHPAECNSKTGKPTNCNVKLWCLCLLSLSLSFSVSVWCCVVWCVARLGTQKKTSVCRFKTSPCVPAPRAHVLPHVRVVPVHTGTF